MLYKKYHRNFVRQFKKGIVFKWNRSLSVVMKEPYYDNKDIFVTDKKYYSWILVSRDGSINRDIKVENVVQEIS